MPVGLAIAGVVGGGISAVGSLTKGSAAKSAADYSAQVDYQRAAEEQDAAQAQTQDYLRKGSDTVATAVADQGATGVTGSGSPLMVDENTVRQVALGAARTLDAGDRKAKRLRDDAELQKTTGKNAQTASYFDAGSSILSSISKFGGGGKTGNASSSSYF